MKTVFDKSTREELIQRINVLNEKSKAQWGKMNVYQMVKHCALWEEMILGRVQCKRVFLGRIFGKLALKATLKDASPIRKNSPSSPELIIKETQGDVEAQKAKWIANIQEYAHFSNQQFIHPFFGKMTREQVGYFAYKHSDHHLKQFNC